MDDWKEERRAGNRVGRFALGWVLIAVLVVVALSSAGWGLAVLLSGPRGVGDAIVEKNRKYAKAFAATRPTAAISRMPAIPVTSVRKITGAMIIFTSLIKPSPSGFSDSPTWGQKWPTKVPSVMAGSTSRHVPSQKFSQGWT